MWTAAMSYKGFPSKTRRVPIIEKQTVAPRRSTNAAVRPREYLTAQEVERLITFAKKDTRRHTHRDATMILIAYRHGLRVRELVAMRCDQLDFHQGSSTSAG